MKTGVILSTYNSPEWLTKVLWGYEQQADQDFELIIADDGSDTATAEVIDRFQRRGQLTLRHVWHEETYTRSKHTDG